jgi:hypothetical protein
LETNLRPNDRQRVLTMEEQGEFEDLCLLASELQNWDCATNWARGSVEVEALSCKAGGRDLLPAAIGPGAYSESNRNKHDRKKNFVGSGERPVREADYHRHLWSDCLDNVGSSAPHNPMVLRGLLWGQLYFVFNFFTVQLSLALRVAISNKHTSPSGLVPSSWIVTQWQQKRHEFGFFPVLKGRKQVFEHKHCLSCACPFQLLNQLTDFHESWYEPRGVTDHPSLVFLISYAR